MQLIIRLEFEFEQSSIADESSFFYPQKVMSPLFAQLNWLDIWNDASLRRKFGSDSVDHFLFVVNAHFSIY